VTGFNVELSGPNPANAATDNTGQFAFNNLSSGPWTVRARKAGGDNGAISAFDAARVLLNATQPLNSLQQLACDVNADGGLDVADAVLIVQRRVGLIPQFPAATGCNNSDWLVFPVPTPAAGQSTTSPNPATMPCTEGAIGFNPLTGQARGQNFLAVLYGDCSGNWKP
jgi:hypothetical protein